MTFEPMSPKASALSLSKDKSTAVFSVLCVCCAFVTVILALNLVDLSVSLTTRHPNAVIRARRQQSARNSSNLCPEWGELRTLLHKVASHATDSYLLEDVLLQTLANTSCRPLETGQVDRLLFVVMCSSDKRERIEWLLQTWLAWLPPQNIVLLSDVDIPGYPLSVLPPLPADAYINSKFPNPSNYQSANLRHLRSVQWLGKINTTAIQKVDWIFMVDDDTFVNLPLLLLYLRHIPSDLPFLIGHLWDSPPWDAKLKGLAYPSGGAGMLLSKVAFKGLAEVLFTPLCEMQTYLNDVTIGLCAHAANITKVHSSKFLPERIEGTYTPVISDVGMVLTMHRAVDRKHMEDSTCIVSKRFNWPHKLCSNFSVMCNPECHAKR